MKLKMIPFLFFLLSFNLFATSIDTLYKKGIEEINGKNYTKAIEIFKKIAKEKESPGVYYNLALAYWNKGEKGYTVYYLKKSLKLFPLYRRSIKALKIINEKTKENERLFYLYLISLLLSLIFLVYIHYILIKKIVLKKRKSLFILYLLLFFLIISAGGFYTTGYELFQKEKGIVIKKGEVKLYAEPDLSSVPLSKIEEGEEVEIITDYGGWYKIKKDKILLGWIKGENIKLL